MYLDIHFCIQYEVVNLAKEKIDIVFGLLTLLSNSLS